MADGLFPAAKTTRFDFGKSAAAGRFFDYADIPAGPGVWLFRPTADGPSPEATTKPSGSGTWIKERKSVVSKVTRIGSPRWFSRRTDVPPFPAATTKRCASGGCRIDE